MLLFVLVLLTRGARSSPLFSSSTASELRDSLFLAQIDSVARPRADSFALTRQNLLTIGDTTLRFFIDTSEFIPWSEYRWADHQMVTLTGEPPRRYTKIQPIPAFTYLGAYFGILTALHYYQEQTFWRSSQSFRIRNNWDESLSANYGGHFIGGYFVSYISEQALIASGVSDKLAPIYGALAGLGYQTYVEILDGFGSDFSFSPYEAYAQTLGVIYFAASQYSRTLQDLSPKVNYYPASWAGGKPKAGSQTPIDDYCAWNFWISANISDLTGWKFWPSWLNIAVGYGARDLGYPEETRVITVALDYDLVKILPDGSPGWNWFRQTFDFLKLPSPGIEWRLTRDGKNVGTHFYLAYPFVKF
jgi:hypothetical protein